MRIKSLALVALIAVATACSKSDELSAPSNFPADGVIRVAATVEESATTRAGMTTDEILGFNLNIVNLANLNYSYYAFCDRSDGEWLYYKDYPQTLQTLLWQNNIQPITVTAVSRKTSIWTEFYFNSEYTYYLDSNQSDEFSLEYSDWLYMPPTVINPATDLIDGKLPITFKHLFSKVHLTVKLGTEFNAAPGTATNPITELKVNGTIRDFRWNPSTNSAFDITGYNPSPITPFAGTYTAGNSTTSNAVAKYECILVPQTVAAGDFTVSFTIGGKNYEWKSAAEVKLESGMQHALTLTAGKEGVTGDGIGATPWTDGGTSDKETD